MGASPDKLELLYRERYGAFRNGLAPVCGGFERAHDVVQEAFARALRERDRFRGEGSLEGWVWRIAFRVALDERRNGHEIALEEAFERAAVPDAERDPELAEALRRLPARRKLVVFLRHFADPAGSMLLDQCLAGSETKSLFGRGCHGLVFENGVFVYVSASSRELLLAAARALKPIQ